MSLPKSTQYTCIHICIQWNWTICHLVTNATFDGKITQVWNLHRNIQECKISYCESLPNVVMLYFLLGEHEISRVLGGLWITISGLSFHIHCLLS